jgi:glyoxylase-like metal-dependent hydrolase (beta-lactamase superfamily II)
VTGAKIIQHENSPLEKDLSVKDGDTIRIGNVNLKVIYTPGHSEDSICLIVDDKCVFTGDTVFVGNCGRTDLPGSDPNKMYYSLFEVLANLDEKLVVYPGHNYGPTSTTTIGQEKSKSYIFQPRSKQEFVQFMATGD